MKNFLRFSFLFLFSVFVLKGNAQVSAYSYSQSSGTYQPITGGALIQSASTTASMDENVYTALNIGFSFNYAGVDYSTFSISANGFIALGNTIATSTAPLSTGTTNNVIAALGADLLGRQFVTCSMTLGSNVVTVTAGSTAGMTVGDLMTGTGIATGSTITALSPTSITLSLNATSTGTGRNVRAINAGNIRYETIGSAPNRKLVVQWSKFSRYTTTAPSDLLNFQIILEETTNFVSVSYDIPYVYTTTNITPQVGLRGAANTDFNNRTTSTDWTATTAGTLNSSNCTLNSTVFPASGQNFSWIPPACAAPGGLSSVVTSLTSANISWNNNAAASSGYDYYVSTTNTAPNAGTTPTGSTVTNSASISGLTANTTYYFWVRSNCGLGTLSGWSATASFFTGYCVPSSGSGCSFGDLIASVTLNTLVNNTGTTCTAAYNDYTTNPLLTTTLLPSSTYSCIVGSGAYGQSYAVWIDYNDDLVFDVSERVGYTLATVPANSTATFSIVLACTPPAGVHRMRVRSAYATAGISITPCGTQSYGEIEDYLITIAAPPACPSPGSPLTASNITAYTADFTFPLGCSSATNFDVEYGPAGFTQGTGTVVQNIAGTINGSNATITLSGLNATTAYNVYVRANCGSGLVSAWVGTGSATTLDPPCTGAPNIAEALATTATSVCPNGSVAMNATGLSTGLSGLTNQWQFSTTTGGPYSNVTGGTGATTTNYSTGALVSPGTYYYVLASTCNLSGQTSYSNEVIVTVNTLPTIAISATTGGNFCGVGDLTATGANTYSWTPAASLLSNTGATVTSIATTNETFTATGTDANGCVNTATYTITYTAPPAITISATTASFCGTGGTSTLTAASSAAYSYAWTPLDGATISATTGNTTDATVTQTSVIRVTGTETATGCVAIENYSIGVYPLPSATVTTTANGVCPGTSATINSGLSAGNFTAACIPFAPSTVPGSATTLVNNGVASIALASGNLDDGGWSNIPIGFTFNYFGTNYTNLNVGTNGVLQFGAYNATALGDFTIGALPNTADPLGAIFAAAHDLNCGTTGAVPTSVKYWTEGYAPNRRFVVQYDVYRYGSTTQRQTIQAVVFETLGTIEMHAIELASTNAKTIGVNDPTGTIGASAPNCSVSPNTANYWQAQAASIALGSGQSWRFAPPSNYTTTWFADGTQFDTGTNIFSESVSPLVTTTYSITYTNQTTGCTNAAGSAQVTMAVLGTVAPAGVNVIASTNSACSGVTLNLTTDYTGLPDGLTYQWQVSTDNGANWADITGATALTYSTSITVASSFRIGITSCGGTIAYSSQANVALAPPTDCYCIPTYSSGTSFGDLISNVEIVGTTLSNNTGFVAGTPSYTFYTGQPNYTATLLPSTSYTLLVSTGEYGDQGYAAWIDYNDDGVFSSTELVGATPTTIGSGFTTGVVNASSSFTIALACTPPVGVHRMRVRGAYFQNGPTIDPCANYGYGETEDYLITIAPAPTCPSPGLMSVSTTTTTSADLTWALGCSSATNYDFEYGPVGFTPGTGTLISNATATIVATDGSYTLTGLTPNTQYAVYYRANCGTGDVSAWSVASNFTTQCAPITLNTINPGIACDSYALVPVTEATPSNNAGLTMGYYTGPNGTGTAITGPLSSSQNIYAYASAGTCSAQQAVSVTVYYTPQLTTINPTLCLGDSTVLWATQGNAIDFVYTLNGSFIGSGVSYHVTPSTTTTYGISAVGIGGCISAEQQATVTVNQPTTSNTSVTSCNTYTWNNQTYTQSGTYTFNTSNAAGCDSIATLNLTINNSTTSTQSMTACDSYSWNGQTYTQSGTYTYQTTNSVGCDSTATLNLTINNSTTSSTSITACVSYSWNGQTYTQSGTYTYVTPNAVGCDSTATLDLTINSALFTTETVSACISYTWNGQTYLQSGTYTYLTTSVNGCDSTVTLNLTINQPNTSTTTQTACDSYTWNGQTYTQSGTYVFNTTTVAGCDSTATLNLTVNASSTSTSTATACGTYSWNGQTYTQSGAYTYTTQNAAGCDSVATLNLTINAIPNATATNNGDGTANASAGSTYQWIDCATGNEAPFATAQTFEPQVTGSYAVIVTNASGCADTSSCITIEVIGLDETKESLVQVQPNPSTGLFNILFGENANGTVVITDATGRIIATETINGSTKTIDLTSAVTGIYYFTIQIDNLEKVIRVIKN